MATVSVANTTANISGRELVLASRDHTITGLLTFDRDPSAPFAVSASSAVVPNLDADKVDGYEASALAVLAENETVSGHWTVSGSLTISGALRGIPIVDQSRCDGRITLTTAVPITTSDVTGAATIYFTPFKGNQVALYDSVNSRWVYHTLTELSIATSGGTASKPHDVFLDYNDGTPALAILAWTNDSTRATALTTQNGIYVKTGDTQQRYLGTVYLDGSKQAEDSFAKREVWNYYNRVPRPLRVIDSTNTWTYTTATFRQANNSTANQISIVCGVAEEMINARVHAAVGHDAGGINVWIGIGEDSTTTKHANCVGGWRYAGSVGGANDHFNVELSIYPAAGRHYYVWLEKSQATGTTTWYGDNATTEAYSGMSGTWMG